MRFPVPPRYRPMLVTVGGLGLLTTSWACFPPVPLTQAPYNPYPPTAAGPYSPPPSPTPSWGVSASPAPTPTTSPPVLTPVPGRVYRFETVGARPDTQVYTIRTVAGEAIGYDAVVTPAGQPPTTRAGQSVTATNGVYWLLEGPSPVTTPIASYPSESLELPIGRVTAAKVEAAGATYWFAEGIIVKALTPNGTTTLTRVTGP